MANLGGATAVRVDTKRGWQNGKMGGIWRVRELPCIVFSDY